MSSPHRQPFGDNPDSGGIPLFNKHGTALSTAERLKMAARKGLCVKCGIRTHELKGIVRKVPLTNADVYNGICIRCNPNEVPSQIYAKWENVQAEVLADQHSIREAQMNAASRAAAFVAPHLNNRSASGSGSDRGLRSARITGSGKSLGSGRSQGSSKSYGSGDSGGDGSFDESGLIPGTQSHNSSLSEFDSGYEHLNILKRMPSSPVPKEDEDMSASLSHLALLKKKPSREPSMGSDVATSTSDIDYSLMARSERSGGSNRSLRASKRSTSAVKDDYTGGPAAHLDSLDVIKGMRNNRDDPEALQQYLHRLRNLGDDQVGALYEIKDVMDGYSNEARFLAVACGAVWGIAALDDDAKIEASESGVLKNVVDALRNSRNKGNEDFVQWAIGCLECLSRGFHNKGLIADAGGIEAILDALETHKDSPGVFEWSARALHALVYQYDDEGDEEYESDASSAIEQNIGLIEDADGVSKIVEAMKLHPSEAIAEGWAIRLLLRLLDQKDEDSTSRLLRKMNQAGAISACAQVLTEHSTTPKVFTYGAELVAMLATALEKADPLLQNTSELCFPSAVRMMKQHSRDEDLQEACCQLIANLERSSRLLVKESRALKEVVAAMRAFDSNLAIQEAAVGILHSQSFVKAFFDTSVVKDAVLALNKSTSAFPDSALLQSGASGFLANASLNPDTRLSDIPLEIPFRTMRAKNADNYAFEQACRALSVICAKVPEKIDRFMGGEDVKMLVDRVKNPEPDKTGYACRALAAIARTKDKNRNALIEQGLIDYVVPVMKNPELSAARKDALDFVASLISKPPKKEEKGFSIMSAFKGSEEKEDVKMSADLAAVITESVLVEDSDDSLAEACGVLSTVLLSLDPTSEPPIDVDRVIARMKTLLGEASTPVGVKRAACEVVWVVVMKYPPEEFSDLKALLESVAGAMSTHQGKKGSFDSDLQSSASGAIGAITERMREKPPSESPITAETMDTIVSVMAMAVEHDKNDTALIEQFLYVFLNLSAIAPGIVTQCGGIVLGIDTMHDYEQCEPIQEKGCAMLALLTGTGDLQAKLCVTETDGVDTTIGALVGFSHNERIQTMACACLSHLSDDPEARSLITSQGGLMLLANAVKAHRENMDLIEYALSAISNLASDSDEEMLNASQVLETAVEVMKRQKKIAALQEAGLDVLKSLSMRGEEFKRAIAKCGGVDVVISVVRDFLGTPSVLEKAFTTMWSLAVLDYNQMSIGRKNGIIPVINGMLAHIENADVTKQGCGCLTTLATNSDNKAAIRNSGGVDVIVYAMWANYRSEALQAEACRALSSMAVDMETNEVMLAGEGEINAIMSAMKHYPNSERLQSYAVTALRNLMLSADNVELIRGNAEELMTLLMIAATNFPDRCAEYTEDIMDSL